MCSGSLASKNLYLNTNLHTVDDIQWTDVKNFVEQTVTGTLSYCVINSICYVSAWALATTQTGMGCYLYADMPKARGNWGTPIIAANDNNTIVGFVYIDNFTNIIRLHSYVKNANGYGSFSYPVER